MLTLACCALVSGEPLIFGLDIRWWSLRGYYLAMVLAPGPLDGLPNQFGAIFELQLLLQAFAIRFDGFDAEMKFFGNLAGAKTVADEFKHLKFAVAESVERIEIVAGGTFHEVMKKFLLHRVAQIDFPIQCRVNGFQDVFARLLFHDVTQRPGAQSP